MEIKMIHNLRVINKGVALVVGFGLLLCAGFVLADIILRQIGTSFGGTEEIAGYVMTLATSWGMSELIFYVVAQIALNEGYSVPFR